MGGFVLKNIEMTLDPASIQKAIDEIKDLSTDLSQALDALCEYLLKEGVTIARLQLRSYMTGKSSHGYLKRSIRYEMANGKSGEGYIVAGYPGDTMSEGGEFANISYAVFFEFGFGTGSYYYKQSHGGGLIKGQASIERNLSAGNFDPSRTTGRTKRHPSGKGRYRSADDSKIMRTPNQGEFYGWVYKDRWTGKFYISRGQPPKPFMYNTLIELRNRVDKDAERFIAEYIP